MFTSLLSGYKKGVTTIAKRYYSAILFGVIILLCAVDTGHSQFTGYARRAFGMTGYISFGINRVENGSLNNDLEMNGYPSFSDLFGAWGGGMHAVIRNRFVIGMSYHRQMEKEKSKSGYKTSFTGNSRSLDVGCIVFTKGYLQIFPLVGIGMQTVDVSIHETGGDSFENILADPGRGASLSRRGLMLDVGLQMNMLNVVEEIRHYTLGVRVGYRFVPGDNDWKIDNSTASVGPESSITGPNINLNIGIRALLGTLFGR